MHPLSCVDAMIRIVKDYLRVDKYGLYLWTPRFCASVMWPLRFWEFSRQHGPEKYHAGNIHAGPFYLAWYDEAATR